MLKLRLLRLTFICCALGSSIGLSSGFAEEIAGTMPVDVSVDNKGAANITVPLELPPGRAKLQPSLSVSYNSQGGNGSLGVGWSLSTGFPQSISRGRSILARDGVVRGIGFDADDKFYLDGKRLILVTGTYGMPGSTYRTEVESFVQITAFGANGNIEGFRVDARDGNIYCFGKNVYDQSGAKIYDETDGYYALWDDTRYDSVGNPIGPGRVTTALNWKLKWVEDSVGNYVEFTWGSTDPATVRYTGNRRNNTAPAFRVDFGYANERPDLCSTRYTAGFYDWFESYLSSVSIRLAGDPVIAQPLRSFGFNYKSFARQDGTIEPGFLRLEEVVRQEYDPSGNKSTKAVFTWGADAPSALLPSGPVKVNPSNIPACGQSVVGDFNGDGRQDILLVDIDYNQGSTLLHIRKYDSVSILYGGQDGDPVVIESKRPTGVLLCENDGVD